MQIGILLQIISIFWGQADANWNEAINLSFDFSPPEGSIPVFIKCIKAQYIYILEQ